MAQTTNEPVAIVGMACRFAGCSGLREFWELLVSGREGVADYVPGRSSGMDAFYGAAASDLGATSRRGGFLQNVTDFDAEFFRISAREAQMMDPQQRLLLELTWEALEDAGQSPEKAAGQRTGVFVGAWHDDYGRHVDSMLPVADIQSALFNRLFAVSSRIAFAFDFRGPELSVNAACASSLVALHHAVSALRSGDCDIAVVGGANVIVRTEVTQAMGRARVLSPDGRCKFGDAAADGFVRGEGGGMLVLKRVSRARADGDRIRALIRGSAVNNSGHSSGFIMRPSEIAQAEVLAAALSDASVSATDLQYIEAHGTGTHKGDRVELIALGEIFGRRRSEPCLVGSVKTNIGHTEAAAGMAGLIKVVLALEHRFIPPTLHVRTPNPDVDWANAGIALSTAGTPWPGEGTRRAGISSFGVGGNNAHAIVEEAPVRDATCSPRARQTWLLPLSANSGQALRAMARAYADDLGARSDLADVVYTAATRRSALPHRLVVVGADAADLSTKLRDFAQDGLGWTTAGSSIASEPVKGPVMIFPGQGSQWLGMGRELMANEPAFAAAIATCDAGIKREAGWSVEELLKADTDWSTVGIERIQPTLFAVQVALAELWLSWGIRPAVALGHSMGEIAAAHVAGAISLEDAVAIICRRSRLMATLTGQGAMALVDLSATAVAEMLEGLEDRVSIAVSNGPRATVVAGDPAALRRILDRLDDRQVYWLPVAVQVAAHSPQMDLIRDELMSELRGIKPRAGHIPIYSTTLGCLTDGAGFDGQYWVRNLRQPVLFHAAVKALIEDGSRAFIEASAHPLLLPAIDETGRDSGVEVVALASMRQNEPEQATMLTALGRLFVHGHPVDWARIYPAGNVVALPAYPWQRRRCWPVEQPSTQLAPVAGSHPLLPTPFRAADRSCIWTLRLSLEALPWLKDHVVKGATLLPASAYLEIASAAAREVFGDTPAIVRDLRLKEAILLADLQDQTVQLVATEQRPGYWSLKFHVHDAAADAWTVVGSARLVTTKNPKVPALSRSEIEAFALGGTVHSVSGEAHAGRLRSLGYDFGPNFLNLRWLDLRGGIVLAAAQVDDDLKTVAYGLHPVILDAGFQALLLGLQQRCADRTVLIPSRIAETRIFPAPEAARVAFIRAECFAEDSNNLGGDVFVYGSDGSVLAEVRGLEFKAFGTESASAEAELLFHLDWREASADTPAGSAPAAWLVICDQSGVGSEFIKALRESGRQVDVIERGANPAHSLKSRLDQWLIVTADARERRGAVHFASLDLPDDAAVGDIAANGAEIARLASLLNEAARCNLWLVTRGARSAGSVERVSVSQSSVWGLGATIANECPDLGCRLIDLDRTARSDDGAAIFAETLRGDSEPRVCLRGDRRYVGRVVNRADQSAPVVARPLAESERADLIVATPGALDSLAIIRDLRRAPSFGEVEIEVQASGLNFLDVIRAMGLYDPASAGSLRLGIECAGRIVRVGDGVEGLAVGDRVMALSPALDRVGAITSHLVTSVDLTAKIPDGMSFAEAAGLPCAWLTSYCALVEAARVRPGETVLIHSATGGVGLAAIQVARWLGAKVIASAGTDNKRKLLRDMGIADVFDSRASEFAQTVAALTDGRGVDVILNSLAGAAIPEGLAALAPYGRFLEIGKRDMWDNSRIGMEALLRNRSLFGIDLASMIEDQREHVGKMLRTIMNLMSDGVFTPLPVTEFPADQAADAFQLMAAARHIGKVVITTESMQAPDKLLVRPDATYLITGGLGALGMVVAEELVAAGALNVVLCGRSHPSADAQAAVSNLRTSGANVITAALDVGNEEQLRGLLQKIEVALPPLRGVVHAAGVLDDALLDQLSAERFQTVMRGKVDGARLLDRMTAGLPLDFFVLFSSVAALLGSHGQGNYAAANAMLDAIAEDRTARGQPGLSIAWGVWGEIGLAAAQANRGARMATRGLESLAPGEGRRLFRMLGGDARYVAAARFDVARWLEIAGPSTTALFSELPRKSTTTEAEFLQPAALGSGASVQEVVMAQLCAVLRASPDLIGADKPFRSLGLDSLMGLELRNRLERAFGIKLSASTVWNFPTATLLCAHLAQRLEALVSRPDRPAPVVKPAEAAEDAAARALEAELLAAEGLLADLEACRDHALPLTSSEQVS